MLLESLKVNNKGVLILSMSQMESFAGNMLELQSSSGETLLVMSEQAKQSLLDKQVSSIEQYAKLYQLH